MHNITDIIIANTFYPFKGGISRYLSGLAAVLSKYCRLMVVSRVSYNRTEISGYSIKRSVLYGKNPTINKTVHYLIAIFSFIDNIESIKRVYAGSSVPYGIICLLMRFLKPSIKVYVFTYGSELLHNKNRMHAAIRDFVLRKADSIITISNYSMKILEQITDKPVIMAPPGYDGRFVRKEHREKTEIKLLTVASLTSRKGQHLVIDALKGIRGQSEITYDIIGNGPNRDILIERARSYGLEGNVHVRTGLSDDEVNMYYKNADIFIMPTYRDDYDVEGFGIVYLEAGAHCLPIIASPVGGVVDIIEDGINGIFVREKNIDDIAEAIKTLAGNKELRKAMGDAAYRTALSFTYNSTANEIVHSFSR